MATDTSNFNFQGIGIVTDFTVIGCRDPLASNYNPSATVDDGSCIVVIEGCMDPLTCAGSYNPLANFQPIGACDYCCPTYSIPGCTDDTACNYDPTALCDDGSCVGQSGCIDPLYNSFNSANTCDCSGVVNGNDNTCCVGLLGCMDDTPSGLALPAYQYAMSNYNPLATVNDPNNPCIACVYGCTDSNDFNYDASATCDDGSCVASVYGCTDFNATNYNTSANIDDGSCIYTVYGCTDSTASNWYGGVPANTTLIDDGNCQYLGCTDILACNYDSAANVDDGSCILPAGCSNPLYLEYDPLVSPTCHNNTNACITLIVNGCTDSTAFNYNASANTDDGSCVAVVNGCTNPTAFNYNASANTDDGTCIAVVNGCMDSTASNYNASATTDDGSCEWCDSCGNCIGDSHEGGIIFYLDGNCGGLIGATEYHVSTSVASGNLVISGCGGTIVGTGTAIGTGNQNTIDIQAENCGNSEAADVAVNYTGGGYTDWFLPSIGEAQEMHRSIGNEGYHPTGYWGNLNILSSSEYDPTWDVLFSSIPTSNSSGNALFDIYISSPTFPEFSGPGFTHGKLNIGYVRAARCFGGFC